MAIICKVKLKHKRKKNCVLAAADFDNVNADSNNVFPIKDTKLIVTAVTLSGKDNKKPSKLLSKKIERSVYWNEYKTKSENKNTKIYTDIFSNQIL